MLELYQLTKSSTPKRGEQFELRMVPVTPYKAEGDSRFSVRLGVIGPDRMKILSSSLSVADGVEEREDSLILEELLGQRLALGIAVSKLIKDSKFQEFSLALADLPNEVIGYWFAITYYGHNKTQSRKALAILLSPAPKRKKRAVLA